MQGNWLGRWAGEWFGRVAEVVAVVIGSRAGRDSQPSERLASESAARALQTVTIRTATDSGERIATAMNDRTAATVSTRATSRGATRNNKQTSNR